MAQPQPLQFLEAFGDAHSRYIREDGALVDLVREGAVWRAYAKAPGEEGAREIASAIDEQSLLRVLSAAQA